MQNLIFTFYLLLFSWLITKISFFTNSGISKWLLVVLFMIKIAAGFAYAQFYSTPQNIITADTWKFYNASLTETAWLLRDPAGFIKDLFHSPYQQSSNLFSGTSSYWNDLKDNVFIKLMAVINVFTNKNYYANIILFNFLYFFGPVALYKLLQPFWNYKNEWLILPAFLLPSFLFWCSGIHKDGLIFSAIMICVYCFQKQIRQHRFLAKYILLILLCFIFLFALRNVIVLLLLPALASLFVSEKRMRYQWQIFAGIYATGLLIFFISPYFSSALNFPQYIIGKQAEFSALSGSSRVLLPELKPSFSSFLSFFPYASDLVFLRPHIGDITGASQLFSFIENTFVVILFLIWIFFHKSIKNSHPIFLFLLFFSLSVLLLCGYIVMFLGAIVRYKSIVTPLLISFLFLTIDFKKLRLQKFIK